jgi:phosphopantothenoylcysteine decarboxylase
MHEGKDEHRHRTAAGWSKSGAPKKAIEVKTPPSPLPGRSSKLKSSAGLCQGVDVPAIVGTASCIQSDFTRPLRVLLLVTGSVAAIKVPQLVHALQQHGFDVKIAATNAGMHFLTSSAAAAELAGNEKVWAVIQSAQTDKDEWSAWRKRGDPVLHIDLRRWADVAVVAPLDANTLAKLAHGMCDNLVTCVLRAWEAGVKPVVLAPAMNTVMYEHQVTQPQLQMVVKFLSGGSGASLFCQIVGPVVKKLECGDVGSGAMSPVSEIADAVKAILQRRVSKEEAQRENLLFPQFSFRLPGWLSLSICSSFGVCLLLLFFFSYRFALFH